MFHVSIQILSQYEPDAPDGHWHWIDCCWK